MRITGVIVSASLLLCHLGCAGRKAAPPPPEPEPPPIETEAPPIEEVDAPSAEVDALTEEIARLEKSLGEAMGETGRLQRDLSQRNTEITELEESHASLELELASALEELIRTQVNSRNVQSRAFAVSRIAEVRVALKSFRKRKDPALEHRLDRAEDFLTHADRSLEEDNVGGAAYLAERAGELLRQVRTISDLRGSEPTELIPIVPPRMLEVISTANLRKGPGADSERIGSAAPGTEVRAVARQGEWYEVEVELQGRAWIHRRLVR
ncbi:MAG: SH3 domain-containing protein [Vicinamibacteria bacterium]